MLTKKDKSDIKDIVVDVIKEVVLPVFETVATKDDLKRTEQRLDNRLDKVEQRLDVVDSKLDKVAANQLDDKYTIKDHEKRLKKLESRRAN